MKRSGQTYGGEELAAPAVATTRLGTRLLVRDRDEVGENGGERRQHIGRVFLGILEKDAAVVENGGNKGTLHLGNEKLLQLHPEGLEEVCGKEGTERSVGGENGLQQLQRVNDGGTEEGKGRQRLLVDEVLFARQLRGSGPAKIRCT